MARARGAGLLLAVCVGVAAALAGGAAGAGVRSGVPPGSGARGGGGGGGRPRALVLSGGGPAADRVVGDLGALGWEAEVRAAGATRGGLFADAYDALFLLAPGEELAAVELESARRLLANGGSLVLTLGSRASDSMVALAKGFGLGLDTAGRVVHDFASPGASADGHSSFSSDAFAGFAAGRGYAPVKIMGGGVVPVLVPTRSELASALLRASPAAFGARPGESDLGVSGGGISLVTALETRTAGRALVLGGLGVLGGAESDQFRKDILAWSLRERGVLRASEVRHWKEGGYGDRAGEMYRIKDELGFHVRLEEWSRTGGVGKEGAWMPFVLPDGDELQVELTMLDPYVRTGLKHVGKVSISRSTPPLQ